LHLNAFRPAGRASIWSRSDEYTTPTSHSARRRAAEPAATIGEVSRSSAQTPTNVAEVAQYVAQLTAELSKMATDAR